MTVYDWPKNLFPQYVGIDPRGMSLAGPVSLSGFSQAAASNADYWIGAYKGLPLFTPDQVNTFRALRSLLKGGSNPIRLPAFDDAQTPWVLDGNGKPIRSAAQVTFDDGATFSDASGFFADVIYAPLLNAASAGDNSVVLNVLAAGTISPGQRFSIGDHLYEIAAILLVSGTQYTLAVEPQLRESVAANTVTNFSYPVCRMRLMTDGETDLLLDRGRFNTGLTMAFIEVVAT